MNGTIKCDHIKRLITLTRDYIKRLSLYNVNKIIISYTNVVSHVEIGNSLSGNRHGIACSKYCKIICTTFVFFNIKTQHSLSVVLISTVFFLWIIPWLDSRIVAIVENWWCVYLTVCIPFYIFALKNWPIWIEAKYLR